MSAIGVKQILSALTGVVLVGGLVSGGIIVSGVFSADTIAATTDDITPDSSKVPPRLGRSVSGNYLAGRQAQILKDYTAASNFYGAVLAGGDISPALVHQAMVVALLVGDIEQAETFALQVTAMTPDEQIANLVLVISDFKKQNHDDVASRLENLQDKGLIAFVKPALQAWAGVGNSKSSVEILKALVPLAKKQNTVFFSDVHTALINEFLNDIPAAKTAFAKLMDDAGGVSLRTLKHAGEFYERHGDQDQAKKTYQNYLEDRPNSDFFDVPLNRIKNGEKPEARITAAGDGAAEVLFGIANLLSQQNAKDMALILSHLGLYLKPEFPALQYLHATVLNDTSRASEALSMFRAINNNVKSTPEYKWEARLHSVAILDDVGREDEAIEILKRMIDERLQEPDALISLGNLYRHHERYEEAIKAYDDAEERIGEFDARDWNLLYVRGIALERAKRWDRAEADFLKALELKPEQPHVMNYLGYSWVEKGIHLDEAQEMIRKAVSKRPNDGFIIDSLGWIYYRLGRYDSAVKELERAIEIRPQDAVINDHLGDAYWRVGRELEAVFQWNRALNLKPEDDVLKVIEDKLENGMGVPESLPDSEKKLSSETTVQG